MTPARILVRIPDRIPIRDQDFTVMRCQTCGAIVPGTWNLTRKSTAAGVDHVLDEHRDLLKAGVLRPPLFVNCTIQDPFWFDEHTGTAP